MISQWQWVDFGIIKEPIKVIPTAKIKNMKLIHFCPLKYFLFNTAPISCQEKSLKNF